MPAFDGRTLILISVFGCATVIFGYAGFAASRGWPVGAWASKPASWTKTLAAVTVIAAPILGAIRGPWWLIAVIPITGFFVGQIAAMVLRQWVQPIAAAGLFIALLSFPFWDRLGLPRMSWTAEEKAAAKGLMDSYAADMAAVRKINSEGAGVVPASSLAEIAELRASALSAVRKVPDSVLAKIHPELPGRVKDHYIASLELFVHEPGDLDAELRATGLHNSWADWWNANRGDFRLPKEARPQKGHG